MTKMLWELKAPLNIALAKENIGQNDLFKYMRYFRMFTSRYGWFVGDKDYSYIIEKTALWKGLVVFCKDRITKELYVLSVDSVKTDPNGDIVSLNASGENGYKRRNLTPNKDCVIMYSDSTKIAPVLYLWAIANEVIVREDIINQQDNMLRKPILISGVGSEFDEAMNKLQNVLSGVQFINVQGKTKKSDNIMNSDRFAEVLNLQVNNAYKGKELWESRGKFEELIKDYLGYTSVNNQKKERMITAEVDQSTSIADTFYNDSTEKRKATEKLVKSVLGVDLKLEEYLKKEEEDNNDCKDKMEQVYQK